MFRALILLLAFTSPLRAQCSFNVLSFDDIDPKKFVTIFYGWVFSKGQNPTIEDMESVSSCFEESFYKNLLLKMNIKGEGEIIPHEFDYVPFTMAQVDFDGFRIRQVNKVSNESTVVSVELYLSTPKLLRVILLREDDTWKISNIIDNVHNLKKENEEAAAYLSSQSK